jgi:hypothetical protein
LPFARTPIFKYVKKCHANSKTRALLACDVLTIIALQAQTIIAVQVQTIIAMPLLSSQKFRTADASCGVQSLYFL